ncbi:MAG: pyridoxal 5'-phosphate synthase glutaminase subunit PdxT [Thermodesulfobacteriota bacterium]|nr:pyridoxal 5'-phosphate synthase glutaminase subunit PdxT [Thermodesulfobacteriota bacterium]
MVRLGIHGLQGDISEHHTMFTDIDVHTRIILGPNDLKGIDGLVLPGGESTTINRLIQGTSLHSDISILIKKGIPVWGTCAGVVLLCKGGLFGAFNASVKRNAYGPQIKSCIRQKKFKGLDHRVPMVFIRAPKITNISTDAEVLAMAGEDIVAARQDRILLTTFHPELTPDRSVARYFIGMIPQ